MSYNKQQMDELKQSQNLDQNLNSAPTSSESLPFSKNSLLWAGLISLLAIIVIWLCLVFIRGIFPTRIIKDTLPADYQYHVVGRNQLPPDFPKSLIVEGGEWQRAEDTRPAAGVRLKVVELLYKDKTPAVLAALFQNNLEKIGWKLNNAPELSSEIVRIFTKAGENLTLIIRSQGSDSLVNITLTAVKS